MTATDLTAFRARLVSLVTDIDRKEDERDRKARRRSNPYRLGIMLNAVDGVCDAIAGGEEPAEAFAGGFIATADMHKAAKSLSLPLDVQRGRWVHNQPA